MWGWHCGRREARANAAKRTGEREVKARHVFQEIRVVKVDDHGEPHVRQDHEQRLPGGGFARRGSR